MMNIFPLMQILYIYYIFACKDDTYTPIKVNNIYIYSPEKMMNIHL